MQILGVETHTCAFTCTYTLPYVHTHAHACTIVHMHIETTLNARSLIWIRIQINLNQLLYNALYSTLIYIIKNPHPNMD